MLKDILDLMKLKEQLQILFEDKLDAELLSKLPSGYSVIGDIAIFRHIDQGLENYKQKIGEAVIEKDPQVNVVIEQLSTESIYRKPEIKYIAGEKRTTTQHKEYNTIFNLDVKNITFSPGNKGERLFLINTIEENEIIVDMFACIGNLSLPVLVNKPSVQCYGIEINEEAFNFLTTNIKENRVEDRYFPILGDNRSKTPKGVATRVLMGYFEIEECQFYKAEEAIEENGWIHYHDLIERGNLESTRRNLESLFKNVNSDVRIEKIRKVKKFSPRFIHLCFDIFVNK